MPTETPTTPAAPEADPAVTTELEKAVAGHRLAGASSSGDRPVLLTGAVLMAAGVVGAFVQYNVTLSQDDPRDIASTQVLVLAFLGLVLVGAALFVAGWVGRVLRLWLLRQVAESEARSAELIAALRGRS